MKKEKCENESKGHEKKEAEKETKEMKQLMVTGKKVVKRMRGK